VRELRHALRYACAVCEGNLIVLNDLPEQLLGHGLNDPTDAVERCASPERQALIDALVRHRWKPTAAAKALGISRATLYRRVHQHAIDMPGRGQT
jgi:transcriptional regulator of acetoin/glycerol metabolism